VADVADMATADGNLAMCASVTLSLSEGTVGTFVVICTWLFTGVGVCWTTDEGWINGAVNKSCTADKHVVTSAKPTELSKCSNATDFTGEVEVPEVEDRVLAIRREQ
jgi:hypothetical protein